MSMYDDIIDLLNDSQKSAMVRAESLLLEYEPDAQRRARFRLLAASAMLDLPDIPPADAVTKLAYAIDDDLDHEDPDTDGTALAGTVAQVRDWCDIDEGGDEWGIEQEIRDYRGWAMFLGDHI